MVLVIVQPDTVVAAVFVLTLSAVSPDSLAGIVKVISLASELKVGTLSQHKSTRVSFIYASADDVSSD